MEGGSGSESPRSIRGYHKGSGTLTGGGVQKVYSPNRVDIKKYKQKIDSRIGVVLFIVFCTLATLLCLYGLIHGSVSDSLDSYVNRTHQIVHELENAVNDNFGGVRGKNETTTEPGPEWLTSDELQGYAVRLRQTSSTIWHLFIANLIFALLLVPILALIHYEIVQGSYVKLLYRLVILVSLLFLIAQFLYLLHPLLFASFSFSSMIDRLFVDAKPRDEYQIRDIESRHSCLFKTNNQLVDLDLQIPCIPRLKNSVLPTYAVLLMMFIDLIPFLFAIFTFAWTKCIKDKTTVQKARQRVQMNNQRRVPIPTTQPPEYTSPTLQRRSDMQLVDTL